MKRYIHPHNSFHVLHYYWRLRLGLVWQESDGQDNRAIIFFACIEELTFRFCSVVFLLKD